MITIQYLEPGNHIAEITPDRCRRKLEAAFDRLPIDSLLLGWKLPAELEDVCREITTQNGVKLYRWHPLLTGDGSIYPEMRWLTQNYIGLTISGFRDLPEFTFLCANNLEARGAILNHITNIVQSGQYDGIFLDRMRFPSHAADPVKLLCCFCDYCKEAARKTDLDLEEIQRELIDIDERGDIPARLGVINKPFQRFLDFREKTITELVFDATSIIRSRNLDIGLDCFSPSLTRMVGQNLFSLAPLADWTKIMLYGHAFGPATLPFELKNLLNWSRANLSGDKSWAFRNLCGITINPSKKLLGSILDQEISPDNIADEYTRGRKMAGGSKLLGGIELVEIPGVSELNSNQIIADINALRAVDADGLSISWDLWQIPLDRLELAGSVWFTQ